MEATGLGGRDLVYPFPWDISIRSDNEGQSIYGPSLALMEEKVDVPGLFGQCNSRPWAGVRLPTNSLCFITLAWTVLNIGMHS